MKFENIRVYNFENALRGMRNAKESYHLIDSKFGIAPVEDIISYCEKNNKNLLDILIYQNNGCGEFAEIGPNDMKLAQTLIKAGPEHRKFLRQIFVSVDITAPRYWWSEFDTYKIGTVANSTSTMHTIHKSPITLNNFEIDDYNPDLDMIDDINLGVRVDSFINDLEQLRQLYLRYTAQAKEETDPNKRKILANRAKAYWKELIRWNPTGWLQTRTVTMNYENLLSMCSPGQRRYHKLNEWSGINDETSANFIKMARQLPYAQDFIFLDEKQ